VIAEGAGEKTPRVPILRIAVSLPMVVGLPSPKWSPNPFEKSSPVECSRVQSCPVEPSRATSGFVIRGSSSHRSGLLLARLQRLQRRHGRRQRCRQERLSVDSSPLHLTSLVRLQRRQGRRQRCRQWVAWREPRRDDRRPGRSRVPRRELLHVLELAVTLVLVAPISGARHEP